MVSDCATAVSELLNFYSAAFCCNYISAGTEFIGDPLPPHYMHKWKFQKEIKFVYKKMVKLFLSYLFILFIYLFFARDFLLLGKGGNKTQKSH